jgi:hypothetical protein
LGVGIADVEVMARGEEIRRHRAARLTETDEAHGGWGWIGEGILCHGLDT